MEGPTKTRLRKKERKRKRKKLEKLRQRQISTTGDATATEILTPRVPITGPTPPTNPTERTCSTTSFHPELYTDREPLREKLKQKLKETGRSRRQEQCWRTKKDKKDLSLITRHEREIDCLMKNLLNSIRRDMLDTHNYCAAPDAPPWTVERELLSHTTCEDYFNSPTNMTFHNLCSTYNPPENIQQLLGLGMKYCIQSRRPQKGTIEAGVSRFARDVRLKYRFAEADDDNLHLDDDYDPKLYIKSKWNPPLANDNAEKRIESFHKALYKARQKIKRNTKPFTNLCPSVEKLLSDLAKDKNLIILITDKNLGPAAMERDIYIASMLEEHLLDGNTYQQISECEANRTRKKFSEDVRHLLTELQDDLKPSEVTFFNRAFEQPDRIPNFYGNPKVHKKRTRGGRIRLRPVTSQSGSFIYYVSTFIDRFFQKLVELVPSYVRNSKEVLEKLRNLQLPDGCKLFTSDATSMYTNIDPEAGLHTLELYIEEFGDELKEYFPKELILRLLKLIMTTSIFKFGNTYWRQLVGTAMGTPCACTYATLFFAYYKRKSLNIPRFNKNLLMYVRFIDAIFGIWQETEENPTNFETYKTLLNAQCKLEWVTKEPKNIADFLDLTLTIRNGNVDTKTSEKAENLFLYIPYNSAHPPGLLKSLVFGRVGTYWEQNTRISDFSDTLQQLFLRLTNRGYPEEVLVPEFLAAAERIEATENGENKQPNVKNSNYNNLFFHIPYHPKDVSRQQMQQLYQKHCV